MTHSVMTKRWVAPDGRLELRAWVRRAVAGLILTAAALYGPGGSNADPGQGSRRKPKAQESRGSKAALPKEQQQDADFAAAVKQWTTRPEFSSPLVDHLPKSPDVPSPKDVLGHH